MTDQMPECLIWGRAGMAQKPEEEADPVLRAWYLGLRMEHRTV